MISMPLDATEKQLGEGLHLLWIATATLFYPSKIHFQPKLISIFTWLYSSHVPDL
jgi:hypothetical protein